MSLWLSAVLRRLPFSFFKKSPPGFKSPYHQLASGCSGGEGDLRAQIGLALELGLRTRAERLIQSAQATTIPGIFLVTLALQQGRKDLALSYAEQLLVKSQANRLSSFEVAELARVLTPVAPDMVLRFCHLYGRDRVASYLAILAKMAPAEAYKRLRRFGSIKSAEYWLLLANLDDREKTREIYFQNYFKEFGISGGAEYFRGNFRRPSDKDFYSLLRRSVSRNSSVSVVITAFNSMDFLRGSIFSLLNQTVMPLEIIVVDDSSTDGTYDFLVDISKKSEIIKPIFLTKNVGTYLAKNFGIKAAKGDYVTFQDSDDWSHPRRLELCAQALGRNRGLVAVSSVYIRKDANGKFNSPKVWPITQWSPNTIFFDRRAILEKGMYMDDTRTGGDSEFVARLRTVFGEDAHKKLRLPLLVAADRPGSLMTDSLTGLDENGFSSSRLNYQEEWSERLFLWAQKDLAKFY